MVIGKIYKGLAIPAEMPSTRNHEEGIVSYCTMEFARLGHHNSPNLLSYLQLQVR